MRNTFTKSFPLHQHNFRHIKSPGYIAKKNVEQKFPTLDIYNIRLVQIAVA